MAVWANQWERWQQHTESRNEVEVVPSAVAHCYAPHLKSGAETQMATNHTEAVLVTQAIAEKQSPAFDMTNSMVRSEETEAETVPAAAVTYPNPDWSGPRVAVDSILENCWIATWRCWSKRIVGHERKPLQNQWHRFVQCCCLNCLRELSQFGDRIGRFGCSGRRKFQFDNSSVGCGMQHRHGAWWNRVHNGSQRWKLWICVWSSVSSGSTLHCYCRGALGWERLRSRALPLCLSQRLVVISRVAPALRRRGARELVNNLRGRWLIGGPLRLAHSEGIAVPLETPIRIWLEHELPFRPGALCRFSPRPPACSLRGRCDGNGVRRIRRFLGHLTRGVRVLKFGSSPSSSSSSSTSSSSSSSDESESSQVFAPTRLFLAAFRLALRASWASRAFRRCSSVESALSESWPLRTSLPASRESILCWQVLLEDCWAVRDLGTVVEAMLL